MNDANGIITRPENQAMNRQDEDTGRIVLAASGFVAEIIPAWSTQVAVDRALGAEALGGGR